MAHIHGRRSGARPQGPAAARLLIPHAAGRRPLHYLVLTGDIELPPKLFERVLVPQVVRDELANAEAPQAVRDWITHAPDWLKVRPADPGDDDVVVVKLDEGESAAIALALAINAELVLMDDREGVGIARRRGLAVTGTLGVLDLVARRGLSGPEAEAEGWLRGPPYAVAESVFDEIDIEGCSPGPGEEDA